MCFFLVEQQVNRLCITPDKQYLAVAGNPHVRLYEIHTQNPNALTSFDGHTGNVTAVGFQKDRKWLHSLTATTNYLTLWELTGQSVAHCSLAAVHCHRGRMFTGSEDGSVKVRIFILDII
jgi:G protein beta subunit-like protein